MSLPRALSKIDGPLHPSNTPVLSEAPSDPTTARVSPSAQPPLSHESGSRSLSPLTKEPKVSTRVNKSSLHEEVTFPYQDDNHKKGPKKTKCPKVKDKNWALVVGEGIILDDIMDMAGRVLGSKILGCSFPQMGSGNMGTRT